MLDQTVKDDKTSLTWLTNSVELGRLPIPISI
jgi:hypothetical protein